MTDPLFHMISDGPRPVAPFFHAVETNGFVFVIGQMPEILTTICNDIVVWLTPTRRTVFATLPTRGREKGSVLLWELVGLHFSPSPLWGGWPEGSGGGTDVS